MWSAPSGVGCMATDFLPRSLPRAAPPASPLAVLPYPVRRRVSSRSAAPPHASVRVHVSGAACLPGGAAGRPGAHSRGAGATLPWALPLRPRWAAACDYTPFDTLRPVVRVTRHVSPALRPRPFHEDRHAHIHILVAQIWAVVPETHADICPLQLREHVPQTIVDGLERMLRMGF